MIYNHEILRLLTTPIAPIYWLAIIIRNKLFDKKLKHMKSVSVPIISIGNLTVGGTGKTPLTIYLTEVLDSAGWHAKIISRGYGGKPNFSPMSVLIDSKVSQTGDEPLMMAKRLGSERVIVGHNRYQAAILALSLQHTPDLIIMDDGFQHRTLNRDLDLLVLDGTKCCGNGFLLPIGDLREPMSGASRASCLIVTRSKNANHAKITQWWNQWGKQKPIFWINFSITQLRDFNNKNIISINDQSLKNKTFYAFCAIGNPKAFFNDLRNAGLTIVATQIFRDHQDITKNHIQKMQKSAIEIGAHALICTEKDAVKLTNNINYKIPLLIAEQQLIDGEQLSAWLLQNLIPYQKQSFVIK